MYYSNEVKEAAKRLFLRRCKAKEIQAQLGLPNVRIVYYWIRQGLWEDMLTDEEPLTAVSRRITLLYEKPGVLSEAEQNELDRLITQRERLAKQCAKPAAPAPQTEPTDSQGGEQPRRDRNERGQRKRGERGEKKLKPAKNDVTGLTEVDFLDKFISKMFGYQKELFAAKQNPLTARIRNILKLSLIHI